VHRLSRPARWWRTLVALTFLVLLVLGTLRFGDDKWPFAPMSQYAFGVDLDGEIRSTRVEAVTVDGDQLTVPLSPGGVGLRRAEVEGQLRRFVDDPSLLEAIAAAYARRHPDEPRYAELVLVQDVSDLEDGAVVGTSTEVLSTWTVPDPRHPMGCCS
jgi:hypothetical protein